MILWSPPPPRTAVPTRHHDAAADRLAELRRMVAALGHVERHWHIYASVSMLSLVALPLWDPGEHVILSAPTSDALLGLMRRAEADAAARGRRSR